MTTPNIVLSSFTVIQPGVVDVVTNTTVGPNPQVVWVQGTVTFTPSVRVVSSLSLDATVYLDPIVGYFTGDGNGLEMDDGTVGVRLIDNVGLGLAPGALTYRVDYLLNHPHPTPPFNIAAPGTGAVIDLNNPAVKIAIVD